MTAAKDAIAFLESEATRYDASSPRRAEMLGCARALQAALPEKVLADALWAVSRRNGDDGVACWCPSRQATHSGQCLAARAALRNMGRL